MKQLRLMAGTLCLLLSQTLWAFAAPEHSDFLIKGAKGINPDHPMTLELLKKAKLPLAAPSANPSGAESPKTARQVMDYFDGKIAAVICTEGLSPLTEAADVGHSMYLSVRINLVITVIAAFVGMFVPAVLLLVKGSIAVSLLISLMLVWVIPVVLVSLFVLKP